MNMHLSFTFCIYRGVDMMIMPDFLFAFFISSSSFYINMWSWSWSWHLVLVLRYLVLVLVLVLVLEHLVLVLRYVVLVLVLAPGLGLETPGLGLGVGFGAPGLGLEIRGLGLGLGFGAPGLGLRWHGIANISAISVTVCRQVLITLGWWLHSGPMSCDKLCRPHIRAKCSASLIRGYRGWNVRSSQS